MAAKPFTKIVDYKKEELEDAILEAVEHAKTHGFDFYTLLRGMDAYFEKRHRRLHPEDTRIKSWQGDFSTGDRKPDGYDSKQTLRRGQPLRSHSGAPSSGSHGGPVQQGQDPGEEDSGDTPSLGSQRPRRSKQSASDEDKVR